jgi:ubiquinol-cytochrome c reductase cytochrome b subunit
VQGQTTLTRFFAVHILILPVTVALFLAVHLSQLRRHGLAPAATAAPDSPVIRSNRPFFPYVMVKIAAAALLVLGILLYLSVTVGAPLEFPADPTNSNYVPRPEWYFLFFYQLLRYFPGAFEPVATVLIPAFIFGCMFLLPFTDRSAVRHPLKKPVTLIAGLFYIVAVIVLMVLALIS